MSPAKPRQSRISVNLRTSFKSFALARCRGEKLADYRPLIDDRSQPLRQEQCRAHLTIREINFPPSAATGLPRGSPRGKTKPQYPPCVRSTAQQRAFLPKSGVKLGMFMQSCPKNRHLPRRFMQQLIKLHKSSFSLPRVLAFELDARFSLPSWQ